MPAPFDIALALRLVDLAAPAYLYDRFDGWAKEAGYSYAKAFHERSLQVKLLDDGDHLLLVFAATDTLQLSEWVLFDFDIRRMALLGGKVHRGFYRALHAQDKHSPNDLFTQIVSAIAERFAHRRLPLLVGGHSLGGAMATMFAAVIADHAERGVPLPVLPQDLSLIATTGQPRIGDETVAHALDRHYAGRYHRGIYHRDWVVNAPAKFLGYRHAGISHFIAKDGEIQFGGERDFHFRSSKDHLPQRYARAYTNHLRAQKSEPRLSMGRELRQTLRDAHLFIFHPGRGKA